MILSARMSTIVFSATAFLVGCGGGTPSTNDSVADLPILENAVTLSGIVTDNPIVNASVEMRVGGSMFASSVPTGSRGDFRLQIQSDNPDALVTGEAYDAVNGVRLSAILDTFEGCQALASDGIVNNVKITNVTTAQQVLAERVALDGSVDTFTEFSEVAPQIDAGELLDLASALKVVIENIDGNTLPSGYANTLDLARAIADGTSTFIDDVAVTSPGALNEARNRLLTDGNATVAASADDAPGVYRSLDANFIYALFDNGTALADFYEDRLVPGIPSWSIDPLGKLNVSFYGFVRAGDSLSVLGQVGDTVHVVAGYDDVNDAPAERIPSNVRKYNFGGAFEAASLAGAWFDPMSPDNQWVFEASGDGYRVDAVTLVQTEPFSWTVTADGYVRIEFAGGSEVLEVIPLDAEEDGVAMVLNHSRFSSQWSTLHVAGFERAATVPGS